MQFQQFRKQKLTQQLHLLQIRLLSLHQRLNSKFTNGHETLVLIPSIDENAQNLHPELPTIAQNNDFQRH